MYLATALDSIVNALLFQWLEDPQGQPYPGEPDTILNIFFKGLLTA
jgi:TetR/AcrR family transcriptional regulator